MKKIISILFLSSFIFTNLGVIGTVHAMAMNRPPGTVVGVSRNLPPVIDGLTAPSQLKVNETGTWTIRAHDPENGILTYSINWGNEIPVYPLKEGKMTQQTTTFTHSYSNPGNYTIVFTITDDHQQTAKTSTTVRVISKEKSLIVISPNGGEIWHRDKIQTIRWTSKVKFLKTSPDFNFNPKVSIDLYKRSPNVCVPEANYCPSYKSTFVRHIAYANLFDGSYSWKISQDIPDRDDYVIRISFSNIHPIFPCKEDTCASEKIEEIMPFPPYYHWDESDGDESDGPFEITGKTIPLPPQPPWPADSTEIIEVLKKVSLELSKVINLLAEMTVISSTR